MKQAGREQLWQQQAEEKQGTRSQNGEAGRKTKRRTGGGMGGREKPRAASTQKLDPAGRAAASASVRASTAIRRPPFLTLVASDKWAAFMAPLARKPHSHRDINI